MTRRKALWWLFGAGLVLFLILGAIDNRMWDEGGPGIIGFELAWTERYADRILAEWGDDGRDAASLSLWIDFLFLAVYSVFWALAARALGGRRVWVLAPLAGAFDFMENVFLHIVLGGAGGATAAIAASFATLKFVCLTVVEGYVAIALVRRFPRAAAAGAIAVVVWLLVNTVLVERATEPARPDGGRIVELPGGDLHVREDGPRDGPPVVLIHGFGASLRWWDGVVPALAREFRVVRIDLLGHGGSEKPREGYSMANQADVVAQAMDALSIPRAAVVGHSMGGIVGTALVERHRPRVAQLMMIGTPPDGEGLEGGVLANAAFWPVVGHATDTLVSDRLVRMVMERGFNPEFDVPDRLVEDIFDRTTWSAFQGSSDAIDTFWDETPLHERLSDEGVPVTVVLGEGESHRRRSVELYNSIPRTRTVVMDELDHSPHVEAPLRVVPLIIAVARGR